MHVYVCGGLFKGDLFQGILHTNHVLSFDTILLLTALMAYNKHQLVSLSGVLWSDYISTVQSTQAHQGLQSDFNAFGSLGKFRPTFAPQYF